MTRPRPTLPKGLPNPFYVALVVVSTLFVVTALGYVMGPIVVRQAGRAGDPVPPLVGWLDRRGPSLLAGEIVAMIVLGLVAMALDQWGGSRKP